MTPLVRVGWVHRSYGGYGGFPSHHVIGGGGWVGHMVVSSIVHGLIYGAIFRLLRHLGLGGTVLLAVLVVGGIYLWDRDRSRRRW